MSRLATFAHAISSTPAVQRLLREEAEGGSFESGKNGRTERGAASRDAIDGEWAGEIDDGHLLEGQIDEPALTDAVLAIPSELFSTVALFGARRQDFGHQVRRAPYLVVDDGEPFGGDE